MRASKLFPVAVMLLAIMAFPEASRAELAIRGCPSVYPLVFKLSLACPKSGGPGSAVGMMVTNLALKGVIDGTVNIGMVSRPLTADEQAAGLQDMLLASDGLTLFVNSDNPVGGLTRDEVRRIIHGDILRWSDISSPGGADRPILVVHHRPECGVNTAARVRFLGDMNARMVAGKEALSCAKVIGEVMNAPGGLGYGPQTITRGKPAVRVLTIDGVAPEPDEIRSGRYPYSFGLRLVFRKNPSREVASFLEFVASEAGKQLIAEAGYVLP